MCKLILVTGEEKEVEPTNGKEWTVEELQKFVGGYIETFPTPNPRQVMILNEEGKFTAKPELNDSATELVREFLSPDDWIAGDVIIATEKSLGREG